MTLASARSDLPRQIGGRVCLDFANTVGPRAPAAGQAQREYLHNYCDLVKWASHVGILATGQDELLRRTAAYRPQRAHTAFIDALTLRETVYHVFAAIAEHHTPQENDLAALQEAYVEAMRHVRIRPNSTGLEWVWTDEETLGRILWPIARSAVELALSEHLGRVKQCPGGDASCAWLFFDTSKNVARRWCSMRSCGNPVKARRQSARRRVSAKPSTF